MAAPPEVDGKTNDLLQGGITVKDGQSSGAPLNGHLNTEALVDLDPLSKGQSGPDVVSKNGVTTEDSLSSVMSQNGTAGNGESLLDLGSMKPDLLASGKTETEVPSVDPLIDPSAIAAEMSPAIPQNLLADVQACVPPRKEDAFMNPAPEGSQIPPPNLDQIGVLAQLQGQPQANDLNLVDLDTQPPSDPVANGNSVDLLADLIAHPPNGPADLPTAPPLEEINGTQACIQEPIAPVPIQPEPALETHKDEPLIQSSSNDNAGGVMAAAEESLVQPESSQEVEACPPVVPPLDLAAAGTEPVSKIQSPKKCIPSPKKSPSKLISPKSPSKPAPKTSAPGVDASKIPSPKKEKTATTTAPVKKTPTKPAERKTPTKPNTGPLRPASVKKEGVDSGIEDDKKPNSARTIKKPTPLKAPSPRTPKPLSSRNSTSSRSSTETPGSPSPNTKNARSKVGSMNNARHIPGGGDKKIESHKVEFKAQSKVGSMKNATHRPGGGDKKIESAKLDWKKSSKTDTGKSAPPPPKRAEKKIESNKLEWKKASKTDTGKNTPPPQKRAEKKIESHKLEWKTGSRVGSLDNATHRAGGGVKKIETKKLEWKAESKVGSMNNVTHKPQGGEKKILSQKLEWNVKSRVGSMDNATHKAGGGDKKIESKKLDWKVQSKVGSLDNAQHKAGGGDKKIESQKLEWKVDSKVGSLDNATHVAGGGDKKVETIKLDWKAESKVGSKDNLKHQAGGGDIQIEDHKLDFKEKAVARTKHVNSPGRSPRMSETSSVVSDN